MREVIPIVKSLTLFVLIAVMVSCDPWFSYSPYEARLEEKYQGNTEKNLALINALDAGDSRSFKIALISDPHYHFTKLQEALLHINQQEDYAFVMVTGDLTENGLIREFTFFHNIMENLRLPYVTAIGNHDYLSNGELVYRQMFGPDNYSFVFNNVKFVVFDNTTIESEKEPDMDWLAGEIINDSGYDHVIPFSHIPPYDGQMKDYKLAFHQLMVSHGIRVSIHGHRHDYSVEEPFGDGVRYATVSSPQKRSYMELGITPGDIELKKIEY
jgi:Icc protein